MNTKFFCLIAAILLIVVLHPVLVATPPEHLDQEQTSCGGSYYATAYPGKLAQSFKPTLNTLTKVKLYGWRNESPPNALKISIRASLNGQDLTSVIVEPGQLLTYTSSWFEADFPNISVTPEATYYLIWSPTEGDDHEPYFWWCYAQANPGEDFYDRGAQFINGEEMDRADFCFQTYGYAIPTVTIKNPSDGTEIGGIISINGTADDFDGSIEKVQVKIDNNQWNNATGNITWSYQWDSRTVGNGWHTISARSYDGESYSEIVSITVNIKNSVINIEGLSGGFGTVRATIHNMGEESVYGVVWSIKVTGGFLDLIDVNTTGEIDMMEEHSKIDIASNDSMFGLGLVDVMVTVKAENANEQNIQRDGFIIGRLLILL